MSTDDRKEALDWAEVSGDSSTVAVVHGLVYVGDMLADLTLEVSKLNRSQLPPPSPKLQALLTRPTPFTPEPHPVVPEQAADEPEEAAETTNGHASPLLMANGRVYKPAHDPRLWRMDGTSGDWISPAGRRFSPQSKQVLGVIRRLEQMRANGTLYTKPINYPEPQPS